MSAFSPIETLIFLVQETIALAELHGNLDKAQMAYLEGFRTSRLLPIYQREKLATQLPFTLCLVGLTNVGKSTLIEVLLGAAVAPKKNGPATAVPVEYSYSPSWTLDVHYHDAEIHPLRLGFADPAALAAEMYQHVIDLTAETASKIAVVCVKGPMGLLANNLVLADTPGFGAAITDPAVPVPDTPQLASARWLGSAGRVYLCVAAGVSWKVSSEEAAFYHSLRHICSNIIVTRWEDPAEAQKEWKAAFGRLFPGAAFEFVNARRGVNVPQLRAIIETQSSVEKRLHQVRMELMRSWTDLHSHFQQVYRARIPWRRDSLERFQASCSHYAELHAITAEYKPCLT